jgi:hypothetical protein
MYVYFWGAHTLGTFSPNLFFTFHGLILLLDFRFLCLLIKHCITEQQKVFVTTIYELSQLVLGGIVGGTMGGPVGGNVRWFACSNNWTFFL